MAATWLVNLLLGVFAFLFTFFFSAPNNTWQLALFRAGIGFLLFFLLGFPLRILLHEIASKKIPYIEPKQKEQIHNHQEPETYEDHLQDDDTLFQPTPLSSLHNRVEEHHSD